MKIYVAGKITGTDRRATERKFQYAADWRKQIIYEDDRTREPGFPVVRGAKKC